MYYNNKNDDNNNDNNDDSYTLTMNAKDESSSLLGYVGFMCHPFRWVQKYHANISVTQCRLVTGRLLLLPHILSKEKKHAPSHVFKVLLNRGVAGMMYVNVCKSP